MCDMKTTILFPAGFGNTIEFCSANDVILGWITKFKCSYKLGVFSERTTCRVKGWQKESWINVFLLNYIDEVIIR